MFAGRAKSMSSAGAACALLRRRAAGLSRGLLLRRSFWVLMFVGHLPLWLELAAGASSPAQALRWLILTASQLFFVFKIFDPACLRLPRDRHIWLVTTVLVGLLHADVARRLSTSAQADGVANSAVLVAGGALTSAAVARGLTRRCGAAPKGPRLHTHPGRLIRRTESPGQPQPAPARVLVRAGRSGRAPPA
ncbi:MAG: hypothetical protein AB1716_09890 [Planctomycetota bacterium]